MNKLLYFIPYVLVSGYHCYTCLANNQQARKVSKWFLMPVLALSYVLAGGRTIWVLLALFFGWLGDVLLFNPDTTAKKKIGAVSFVLGHICFITIMTQVWKGAEFKPWYIAVIAFFLALGVADFFTVKRWLPKDMKPGTLAYFEVLSGLWGHSIVCAIAFAHTGAVFGTLWAIGYPIFLRSDSILTYQWFTVGDPCPKYDFRVMFTYCLGQMLLILGFIF